MKFRIIFRFVMALAVMAMAGLFFGGGIRAQETPESVPAAPDRAEGEGPYERLVIRGAILIDGTGAPPYGPVDIVI